MRRSLLGPRFPVNLLKQRSRNRFRDLRYLIEGRADSIVNLVPFLQHSSEIDRAVFAEGLCLLCS